MKKDQLLISTIASDCADIAKTHNLGIEIAEFCTASYIDEQFLATDALVQDKINGISVKTLHGPFNELFPCAIDPLARKLAKHRYNQSIQLAKHYQADKVILHGGYNPKIYYSCWYVEQSIEFWKQFMQEYNEDIIICLENVYEETPEMLLEIINAVGDQRLGICLDIGHINAYSNVPLEQWLNSCAPYIKHFHVHNNNGDFDTHQGIDNGNIDVQFFFTQATALCPNATFALEVLEAKSSVSWCLQNKLI